MADHSAKDELASAPVSATPPAGGKQDHQAMRVGAMLPLSGPEGTHTVATGGGLDVPGREPQSSEAMTTEMSVESAIPELIPGAYERNTASPRQSGGMGGRFNGADNAGVDLTPTMDERTAEEHRREGGELK